MSKYNQVSVAVIILVMCGLAALLSMITFIWAFEIVFMKIFLTAVIAGFISGAFIAIGGEEEYSS